MEKVEFHDYTAVLLMTHDYNRDKELLPLILRRKPPYLGILGPKKRMEKLEKEAMLTRLSNEAYFYSPIGLDIGAENPEEIALSISSEIIAHFRHRDGTSLKHRIGRIHESNEIADVDR